MAVLQNQQAPAGYGPNPGTSGNDPRGRSQNQIGYQQQRYESQQGPLADAMSYNYGRSSEADYGDRTDIMNQYRSIAQNGGVTGSGGGGGGPASHYSAYTVTPERVTAGKLGPLQQVTASNPFESYKGYQEFGQTGGYSPQDISNMRARGVAPIRAAYDAANRNIGQQRSLQGGYSPNAIATQAKMAREQGQSMSDAAQNVEAGIATARNQGRLAGYGGMAGIEGQRLGAQMQGDIFNSGQNFQGQQFDIGNELDASKFNSTQGMQGQIYNADAQTQAEARNNAAAESAAARSSAAAAQSNADRFRALEGMQSMYGTTPAASALFGSQAMNIVGQGGNMGGNFINAEQNNAQLPGAYDQAMGKVTDALNLYGRGSDIASGFLNNRNPRLPTPPPITTPYNGTFNPATYGRQVQMSQPPPPPTGINPSFDPTQYGGSYGMSIPPPNPTDYSRYYGG